MSNERIEHKNRTFMRRIVCLFLLCCLTAGTFAWNPFTYQREKYRLHDFGIAIGLFRSNPLENANEDFALQMRSKYLMDDFSLSDEDYEPLTINGYYLYHLNERWSLGATIGWNYLPRYSMDRYDYSQDEAGKWRFDGLAHAKVRSRAFHFMPTVKYIWLNTPRINFYAKGSVGIYYRYLGCDYHEEGKSIHTSENGLQFAYQVTPFGLDLGDGPVRFFVEMGYGASGILKVGVCCKLHRIWRDDAK